MSNILDESLGYMYISEQVSPMNNAPSNVNVCQKPNIFYVEFDATLQSFGVMNRNHRIYDIDNVWNCINSDPKIQALLHDNAWFGECDHPASKYKDKQLSPERILNPDMNNSSHKIMSPRREGNLIKAHIQTDAGTEAGMNFAKKIIQGLIPGFSARAVASIENRNGKPMVNVKKIITYDWVLYPSHPEAHIDSKPQSVVKPVNESTMVTIMPLKEILEYAGKKNVNSQVILESFDLTYDNIIGFDKSVNHMIIKDKDNMIYCNMDPKLRHKIIGDIANM